jgi:predicted PurR-regulated permease PerM
MTVTQKIVLIVGSFFMFVALGLWGLGQALMPLLLSFALAYLLFPVIKKLEAKGIGRHQAVMGVFLCAVVVVGFASTWIIPELIADTRGFVKELPNLTSKTVIKLEKTALHFGYEIDLSPDNVRSYLEAQLKGVSGELIKTLAGGVQQVFSGVVQGLIAVLNVFLIPLFFFYLINDYERISANIQSFVPPFMQPRLAKYLSLSNQVLNGYIRGQLMVALILGVFYALGLSLIGLKFAVLIGLVSGVMSLIPYAGFALGFMAALIIAVANYTGMELIFGVVGVFVCVQALESVWITPKLVGDKVGLNALVTMLALIIGGNLLGMMGMMVAIPVAAIAKSILIDIKYEYHQLTGY